MNQGGLLASAQGNGGVMFPLPLEEEQLPGGQDALKPALPFLALARDPSRVPPPWRVPDPPPG